MPYKTEKYKRIRVDIFKKTAGQCFYCGIDLSYANWAVEHMTPRCRGGGDDIDNLVPACHTCNSRKGVRTVEEFRDGMLNKAMENVLSALDLCSRYPVCSVDEDGSSSYVEISEEMFLDLHAHISSLKISFAWDKTQ